MTYILTAQIVVFFIFLVLSYMFYGWTDTISAIYYRLKNTQHEWMFIAWAWLVGLPMFFVHARYADVPGAQLFLISGAAMFLLGIAGAYRWSGVEKAHAIGAIVSILAGAAGIWVVFGSWHLVVGMGVLIGIAEVLKLKNKVYWQEIAAFVCIWLGLVLH